MSIHDIDIGTFDTVEVSGPDGDAEFRFMTREHGDIHLHQSQVVALILKLGEVLSDAGILDDGRPSIPPWRSGSIYRSVKLLAVPREARIPVLKVLRSMKPDRPLKEGMDLIKSVPVVIADDVLDPEAEEIKSRIEAAGGSAAILED